MPVSKAKRVRQRENRRKKKGFDVKDLTPENAFRVMKARAQVVNLGLDREDINELDYIAYK